MENAAKKPQQDPEVKNGPWRLRLDYNSPVILTFTLFCGLIFILDRFSSGWFSLNLFSISPGFGFSEYLAYPKLVSHVFGHASAQHLTLNLSIILLVGPILEEKYGPGPLLVMIAITSLATGLLHVLFFPTVCSAPVGLLLCSFYSVLLPMPKPEPFPSPSS